MLNDVEFREVQEIAKVSKVKVVACDGKGKLLNNFYALFCVVNLFFITKSHEIKNTSLFQLLWKKPQGVDNIAGMLQEQFLWLSALTSDI